MGTALAKVLQCSHSLPDWVSWSEVGVSQFLVVGGVNIPEKYIRAGCIHLLVLGLNVRDSHPVALSRPRNITVHQLIQLLGPARFVSSTSLPEKSPWLKESSSSANAILFCVPPSNMSKLTTTKKHKQPTCLEEGRSFVVKGY